MSKRFFKGMETFAKVILAFGIAAVCILFFLIAIVWVDTGLYTSHYEVQFSFTGFLTTIGVLFTVIIFYYLLKGIALIGQKLYADESEGEAYAPPSSKRTDAHTSATGAPSIRPEEANPLSPRATPPAAFHRTAAIALVVSLSLLVLFILIIAVNLK